MFVDKVVIYIQTPNLFPAMEQSKVGGHHCNPSPLPDAITLKTG